MSDPTGDGAAGLAAHIASRLRDVPDFPQPGIVFKDISPLLADPEAFGAAIRALAGFARELGKIDLVAGIEARGFLFAAALACELGCGMVPIRKAGKLPPPTLRRAYDLEYGQAEIEVPTEVLDGRRVYLVDDVLATGGTVRAAAELIDQGGGHLAGVGVLLELGFLHGRERLEGIAHGEVRALLRT
jgi:adenine phosphoribosyltransferase